MTILTQLDPSVPVHVIDKGSGEALFLLDYGKEDDVLWGVALDNNGEVWWVPNHQIRLLKNYSIGRNLEKS